MGRYRRGHKHRGKWRGKKRKEQSGGDWGNSMSDDDWTLIEKYLLEYRSKAYDVYKSKQQNMERREQKTTAPVRIGSHNFLPLTVELCSRPFINLPDSLSGKERRRIHALCASLDLFHAGAGGDEGSGASSSSSSANHLRTEDSGTTKQSTRKRRIAISIYADGLTFVPDLESSHMLARSNRSHLGLGIFAPLPVTKDRVTIPMCNECKLLS